MCLSPYPYIHYYQIYQICLFSTFQRYNLANLYSLLGSNLSFLYTNYTIRHDDSKANYNDFIVIASENDFMTNYFAQVSILKPTIGSHQLSLLNLLNLTDSRLTNFRG